MDVVKVSRLVSQLCLQTRGDGGFGLSPNDLIDQLAVLKNQQRGNASNAEFTGSARILVDIKLRNFVASGGFGR